MTSLRRAAAAASLVLALVAGCQSQKPPEPAAPGAPSSERVAAARAAYAAKGDMLVGVVDDANERFAAVSGIETSAAKRGDTFTFIDVNTNKAINFGTLYDTSAAGRLIIEYDQKGDRAPRGGDLCVKPK
jgi:hypothetical protein